MKKIFLMSLAMAALGALLSGLAMARGPTFSIDFQGPTAGGPGPFTGVPAPWAPAGVPIDEGQILTTSRPGPPGPNPPLPGPLPPPGVMVTSVASPSGSVPGGLGIVPGIHKAVEVDALSYGRDRGNRLFFSVDEWAIGIPGAPPDVASEGALGSWEAAADVFLYRGPPGIMGPGPVFGNKDVIDGDGLAPPIGVPGTGLREANPPFSGMDEGDNLDAVDVDTTLPDVKGWIFFSMDSNFADPREFMFPPINSGTAVGNGFVGGDVVVTKAGGVPTLYAAAPALGLDLVAGAKDLDDLDALVLWDDGAVDGAGNPFFSLTSDRILFSVRTGSAVIGMPDSRFGAPIEPGDVLEPPLAGGFSPFPAIFVAAEPMGLATVRSGVADFGDDLDALDVVPEPGTIVMLASVGLMGLIAFARCRRNRKRSV